MKQKEVPMKKCIVVLCLCLVAVSVSAAEKENKLTLNFNQRIAVMRMLPQESDLQTLLTVRKIRNKVKPTDEEKEEFGIADTRSGMNWNPEKTDTMRPITISLDEGETKILKDAFKKANKERTIPALDDSIDLYKTLSELE